MVALYRAAFIQDRVVRKEEDAFTTAVICPWPGLDLIAKTVSSAEYVILAVL